MTNNKKKDNNKKTSDYTQKEKDTKLEVVEDVMRDPEKIQEQIEALQKIGQDYTDEILSGKVIESTEDVVTHPVEYKDPKDSKKLEQPLGVAIDLAIEMRNKNMLDDDAFISQIKEIRRWDDDLISGFRNNIMSDDAFIDNTSNSDDTDVVPPVSSSKLSEANALMIGFDKKYAMSKANYIYSRTVMKQYEKDLRSKGEFSMKEQYYKATCEFLAAERNYKIYDKVYNIVVKNLDELSINLEDVTLLIEKNNQDPDLSPETLSALFAHLMPTEEQLKKEKERRNRVVVTDDLFVRYEKEKQKSKKAIEKDTDVSSAFNKTCSQKE